MLDDSGYPIAYSMLAPWCARAIPIIRQEAITRPCAGMQGLIEEGEAVMGEDAAEQIMDAALIGAAQRVEHYEIAAYGAAGTFAERLGNNEAVDLLQQTLDEEKEKDQKLTEISEQLLESMDESGLRESEESGGEGSSASRSRGKTRTSRG